MEEFESPETRERVGRWMEEGQYLLGRVIPTLIEQRDRLKGRAEAAEQACQRLREELGQLQHELSALRTENHSLRNELTDIGQWLNAFMEHLNQMLKLVGEAHQRFPTMTYRRP